MSQYTLHDKLNFLQVKTLKKKISFIILTMTHKLWKIFAQHIISEFSETKTVTICCEQALDKDLLLILSIFN